MFNLKYFSIKKVIIFILAIVLLFFSMKFFEKQQMMTGECSSAYLSGAANWSLGTPWRVNNDEMVFFEKLERNNKLNYRFTKEDNLEHYNYNAIGLLHINALARNIFFWQGDLQSIISLQQLVHVLLSFWILLLLKSYYHKIIFYFLYVINPIILYFVDFPYYYFWQVVPSAIFIVYLLNNKLIKNKIFLISIIFAFVLITRPSTLFILLFILGYIGYQEGKIRAVIAMVLFLGLGSLLKPSASYEGWHTMYVGIGAYQNKYGIEMKDRSGFQVFNRETDKVMIGGCKQNDNSRIYNDFIKKKYFNILKESPLLLAKNALLNILQSYGIGYKVNMMNLNYLSSFFGFLLIFLLLYFNQYTLFFAIGFAGASFTPYFPPIGAYMFGSYMLIIFAWLVVGTKILNKIRKVGV